MENQFATHPNTELLFKCVYLPCLNSSRRVFLLGTLCEVVNRVREEAAFIQGKTSAGNTKGLPHPRQAQEIKNEVIPTVVLQLFIRPGSPQILEST